MDHAVKKLVTCSVDKQGNKSSNTRIIVKPAETTLRWLAGACEWVDGANGERTRIRCVSRWLLSSGTSALWIWNGANAKMQTPRI